MEIKYVQQQKRKLEYELDKLQQENSNLKFFIKEQDAKIKSLKFQLNRETEQSAKYLANKLQESVKGKELAQN